MMMIVLLIRSLLAFGSILIGVIGYGMIVSPAGFGVNNNAGLGVMLFALLVMLLSLHLRE